MGLELGLGLGFGFTLVYHVKVSLSFLVRVRMNDLLLCALTYHFFLTLFSTPLAPLVTWNSLTGGGGLSITALGGRRSNVSAPRLSDSQACNRFLCPLPSTFTRAKVGGKRVGEARTLQVA